MHTERVSGAEIQGGCMCGAVRFTLSEAPSEAGYCHCTRCQRRTGTAASAQARIDASGFALLSGADSIGAWRHSDGGFEKCFCMRCGSQLFSRNPDDPSPMSIRMSAFDAPPPVTPSYRQFVNYAASWEAIPDDGLQRYGEGRPRPRF